MNVYDFDGTIYDGDSSIDLYLFCVKKRPSIFFKCILIQISGFLQYYFRVIPKEKYKEKFFSFTKHINIDDILLKEFWDKHFCRIKKWYLLQKCVDDVIISASPQFLLQPVCKRLNVVLIASKVNPSNGNFEGKNCYGEEKVVRFFEKYPDGIIKKFYTDSYADMPLIRLAEQSFLVKKDKLLPCGGNMCAKR